MSTTARTPGSITVPNAAPLAESELLLPGKAQRRMLVHDPRLFVLLTVFLLMAQVAGVVGVNYVVNPRSEFTTDWVPPLIQHDIQIKMDLLDAHEPVPGQLIFGSSRSMTLPPSGLEQEGREAAFNLAVSGGNLADAHALYRWTKAEHGAPSQVVVGIDLERLWGDQHEQTRVLHSPAGEYSRDPPGIPHLVDDVLDTYSLDYLEDSATALRFAIMGAPDSVFRFDADGVRHFLPFETANGTYDTAPHTAATAATLGALLDDLPSGTKKTQTLDRFVAEMVEDGVQITLLVTPYHPDLWAKIPELRAVHGEAVIALLGHCGPSVRVVDLATVEAFGGSPDDFQDGWHFVGKTAEAASRAAASPTNDSCRSSAS